MTALPSGELNRCHDKTLRRYQNSIVRHSQLHWLQQSCTTNGIFPLKVLAPAGPHHSQQKARYLSRDPPYTFVSIEFPQAIERPAARRITKRFGPEFETPSANQVRISSEIEQIGERMLLHFALDHDRHPASAIEIITGWQDIAQHPGGVFYRFLLQKQIGNTWAHQRVKRAERVSTRRN